MIALESTCFFIVAGATALALRRAPDSAARRAWLLRFALLGVAAWVAEEAAIRLYGFYFYSPAWSVFIGHVPLMVVLIWPLVVMSAREIAGALGRPGAAALLVLADAALMEPIAVQAGLWWWTEPGLFHVPPVGILGWAFFAAAALWLSEGRLTAARAPLTLLGAPVLTHLALLASWWGALRWVNGPIPDWTAVIVAAALGLVLTVIALRTRARARLDPAVMLVRVPPALFFFTLLAIHGREVPALWAWALAFAPPYLAITPLRKVPRP